MPPRHIGMGNTGGPKENCSFVLESWQFRVWSPGVAGTGDGEEEDRLGTPQASGAEWWRDPTVWPQLLLSRELSVEGTDRGSELAIPISRSYCSHVGTSSYLGMSIPALYLYL